MMVLVCKELCSHYVFRLSWHVQELAHELGKPGVDPDVHDKHCNAPVHSIVKRKMKGKKKIALLEVLFTCSCANIDLQGPNGYTALHFAAEVILFASTSQCLCTCMCTSACTFLSVCC